MRNVVVTGASTGIGRASALKLDGLGWRVFAGVRREQDAASLKEAASANLVPMILDVTDAAQIENAVKIVGEAVADEGLHGLVNNAGIAVAGPLEFMPLDAFRLQLEVNVIGVVAVTQAFLPAIRAAKGGRIVNIGSIGGTIAVPFTAPYGASKFAIEAISDSLRMELAPWLIGVSLVKPAAVATPIWERGRAVADAIIDRMPERARTLYAKPIERMRILAAEEAKIGAPPEDVAKCVVHALTASKPKTRYLVGPQVRLRNFAGRFMPDRLRDKFVTKQMGLPR